MVTADEIGGDRDLRRPRPRPSASGSRARRPTSASRPGEYAAHEGGERALFAVLEGTDRGGQARRRDRARRRRARTPGDIFGEVPIALGTVFPVGFRAAEPSRVMRIEPHDYHAVAAAQPDVAEEVGRLAATGSAGRAACRASPPSRRRRARSSSGTAGTPSCTELRRFLDRNQITFRWLTPDAPDAAEHWGGPLPADGDCPAIRVVDGKTVVRPQLRRVAELLGLATEPAAAEYDTVIVGAGPGRPGRGRLRRVGGPAHDRGRARGARRPGRHVVADRELPRLPVRRVGRRAREPRAAAGAAARRRDPRHPDDHADRRRDAPGAPRRRRRPAGADDHPRLRRRVAAAGDRRASTGSPGRASPTARRAARRRTRTAWTSTSSARATRPGRRRCSSPTTRAA